MVRMPDPTAPACDCRWAERMADEPMFPIAFDATTGEYQLLGAGGASAILYHCPCCGGSLPKSKRQSQFHPIMQEELHRLQGLVRKLRTLADVEAALGPPERDDPQGYVDHAAEDKGRPRADAYRTLSYNALSETINVQVVVAPNGDVAFSYLPKRIQPLPPP